MGYESQDFFRTWDGTRLAFRVQGPEDSQPMGAPHTGPRQTVLFVNGLFNDDTYWMHLHRQLAPRYRLVGFDHRGHGRSDPPRDHGHCTIPHVARDVAALLDHLETPQAHVAGFSLGVQVAFEFYREHRTRCRSLLAITGPFENPLATFYGLRVPDAAWDLVLGTLARRAPRLTTAIWRSVFRLPVIHPVARLLGSTRAPRHHMRGFYRHQLVVDVPTGLRMALAATRHSARDVLPDIQVPVLVVAGGADTFTPAALSETMRDEIPDVTFLKVQDGTHTTLLEHPHTVNRAVGAFLQKVDGEGPPGRERR